IDGADGEPLRGKAKGKITNYEVNVALASARGGLSYSRLVYDASAYVIRTDFLLGANPHFDWRHCLFDLRRFADQTKYARTPAQRTQLHDGAMDRDPPGDRTKS